MQSPSLPSILEGLDKAPVEKTIKISPKRFSLSEQRCLLLSPVSQDKKEWHAGTG